MRIDQPQPAHRRPAGDDALAVVGSSPVRRGLALVAVVGGALSAAAPAVSAAYTAPEPAEPDPAVSLAAHAENADADEEPAAAAQDDPILDTDAVMRTVRKANEEGRRLAADTASRDDDASADLTFPVQPEQRGTASMPGQLIDTNDWYLTLPTGQQGSPDTIDGPQLATFHNKFFALNGQRNGIVFSAGADGVTTKNSHYPRSELREMNGAEKASWSNTSGTHVIDVREAFTKLPEAKPEVVGVQIHDAEDDVMQIRLEGKTLMVQSNDGKTETVLDPDYQLGTPFDTKIIAADGKVDVLYNGQKKASLPLSGSGWYWKVGAYVQSNASKGDGPASTGEVTVYRANVTHSGAA